jgi:hypothetical protein
MHARLVAGALLMAAVRPVLAEEACSRLSALHMPHTTQVCLSCPQYSGCGRREL